MNELTVFILLVVFLPLWFEVSVFFYCHQQLLQRRRRRSRKPMTPGVAQGLELHRKSRNQTHKRTVSSEQRRYCLCIAMFFFPGGFGKVDGFKLGCSSMEYYQADLLFNVFCHIKCFISVCIFFVMLYIIHVLLLLLFI